MAHAKIEQWFKTALGRGMNLDRVYGFQCVDVVNDYGNYLFGNWEKTVGRGNAKDKYGIMPSAYWTKIKNDPKNPKQIPKKGDVICWGGWSANPVGHIAVVEAATKDYVVVFQQDGFFNTQPTHRKTLPYVLGGKLPIGWLRPKLAPVVSEADKLRKQLKLTQDVLAKTRKTLQATQDALKKANAALDSCKAQEGVTAALRKELEASQAKNDKLLAEIDKLEADRQERDEAVDSLWKTVGDFINKILKR